MSNAVWYFTTEGEKIVLRARFEQGGIIRDAVQVINPGETFCGVPYDDFKKAGAGTLEVTGEIGRIAR